MTFSFPRACACASLLLFVSIRTTWGIAPPLVRSVTPSIGSTLGGQNVEIKLDNFRPCTFTTNTDECYRCRFDATDVFATYDTKKRKILCTAPAHKTGTIYVEVGVQSVFSFASGVLYSYEPPMLQSIFPRKGPTWGEVPITLTGSNFVNLDELGSRDVHITYKCRFFNTSFGDVTRPALLLTSSTHLMVPLITQLITCVAPPSKSRCVLVEASLTGVDWDRTKTPPVPYPYMVWSQESKVEYCYQQPEIASLWPVVGPVHGGTLLRITGINVQPVDVIRCVFTNYGVHTQNKIEVLAAMQRTTEVARMNRWMGIENDTEAIFCTTPPFPASVVKVSLSLDGKHTSNSLNFRYELGKITRVVPRTIPTRGGTLISIFGVGFEQVPKPRCKFLGNHLKQKFPAYSTITTATVVSSNLVLCESPNRLGHTNSDAHAPFATTRTPERHTPETGQSVLEQYEGTEQVDVNTFTTNSFVMRCGQDDHASAAYHRSLMLFGDVTMEAWINLESANFRVDGSSPVWFGLTDENKHGRFLYGMFLRRRKEPHFNDATNSTQQWVVDVEVGHTNSTYGPRYGGRYNLSWPFKPSPHNYTQVFNTSLQIQHWHHLSAVRNATARTWTLYVNATQFGQFSYGCPSCVPDPKPTNHTQFPHFRQRLVAFFREYDPFMLASTDVFMNSWAPDWDAMFEMLRKEYVPPVGNPSGRPGNILPQDHILEDSAYVPEGRQTIHTLNAGGVDPRTRHSPFACDVRIHGVNVCHLPWGSSGHHTVPNLFVCAGDLKYAVLEGKVEEVRVWKVARTQEQIQQNFDVELDGGSLGIVAYYSFNEGHGVMAFDNSTGTTLADQAKINLHLLGRPSSMWVLDGLLSAFSDSSTNCGKHCQIDYIPTPRTFYLPNSPMGHQATHIDAYQSSQVYPDSFSLVPSRGPMHGGTLVTISGMDFINSPTLGCRFTGTVPRQGGKSQGHGLVNATWKDMNHVVCRSPAAMTVGATHVFLTNDGENFASTPLVFEYSIAIPTLTSISLEHTPISGAAPRYCPIRTPLQGGTMITIHGSDFLQSDSSQLLQFRMGELPAQPVTTFVNSETVVIKTPPIHLRFWGDPELSGDEEDPLHQRNAGPAMHPQPPPGRLSPEANYDEKFTDINGGHTLPRHGNDLDLNYSPWGGGRPFDCTLDGPGTTCLRPAFTVRVTNDGGRTWSDFPPYNTSTDSRGALIKRTNCVLYHDLIVSPDGDDQYGDGTYTRPFKTLGMAANRAHGNYDRIVVQRGEYSAGSLVETLMQTKRLEIVRETTDHVHKHAPNVVTGQNDAGVDGWAGRMLENDNFISGLPGDPSISMDQSIPRGDFMGRSQPEEFYPS